MRKGYSSISKNLKGLITIRSMRPGQESNVGQASKILALIMVENSLVKFSMET